MCDNCGRFPHLAERSRSWANAAAVAFARLERGPDPDAAGRSEHAQAMADAIFSELHPTPLEQSRCLYCGDPSGVRCCEFGRDR